MAFLPERVADGVERLALRTPTLPPATETNTWLVEHGGHFVVIEPATPHAAEQNALLREVRNRIRRGLVLDGAVVTHHHADHVGAADRVAREFEVPLYAHAMTQSRLRGKVKVSATLAEGSTLLDGVLMAMHTPGHAPGHLCFLHRDERWLVAGDMVAGVGTILIDSSDGGDMAEYIAQLERLATLAPKCLLPAHGDPIFDAVERLEFYVRHRREREEKIFAALPKDGAPTDVASIVRVAYDDTPVIAWPLAARSAVAHLRKLEREGHVRSEAELFARTSNA